MALWGATRRLRQKANVIYSVLRDFQKEKSGSGVCFMVSKITRAPVAF